MSCGCNQTPCACPPQRPCTRCDLYVQGTKNAWVLKGPSPEDQKCVGICILDTITDAQVIYVLERSEKARQDLLAVTSDRHLRELAGDVPRLPVVEEADMDQALVNRPNEPAQNPFYAVFRGQPPFAQ